MSQEKIQDLIDHAARRAVCVRPRASTGVIEIVIALRARLAGGTWGTPKRGAFDRYAHTALKIFWRAEVSVPRSPWCFCWFCVARRLPAASTRSVRSKVLVLTVCPGHANEQKSTMRNGQLTSSHRGFEPRNLKIVWVDQATVHPALPPSRKRDAGEQSACLVPIGAFLVTKTSLEKP